MSAEYHAKKFLEAIRKASEDKVDPVSEWRLLERTGTYPTKCICEKEITNIFYIQNKKTLKVFEIGSDCAERWLSCCLQCQKCFTPLGNIMKRRRDQNYWCKKCSKDKVKKDNSLYWWSPDYYGQPWHIVKDNHTYIDWLANLPNRNRELKPFMEYCKEYYYDFEEVL